MMHRKFGRWFYMVGGLFITAFLILLIFFYLNYTTAKALPTIPVVRITGTYPEDSVAADQSVVVFGQANDPDGIAEVQLWVNGQMVASQTNPDQASTRLFEVSQAFIPTGASNYVIILRAIDTKGNAGRSDPAALVAVKRLYSHAVAPGETLESIAGEFGTTPQDIIAQNPGIGSEPAPGTPLIVPPAPAGAGADGTPRVDPPAEPILPTGGGMPAAPASPEFWTYLPLADHFMCLFVPELCSLPPGAGGGGEPSPVLGAGAAVNDSCQATVTWQDTSEFEVGFRIYRVTRRPVVSIDLVAVLRDAPGMGTLLSFVDENPPNGEVFYVVAPYGPLGERWSAPTNVLTVGCRPPEAAGGINLAIEALDIDLRDAYDRLYCYASLAGLPFERVPQGSSFIELESGSWNIAEHFSGENKRMISVPDRSPINIVVECLGWRGDTLVNLGQFSRTHPEEEWDGRLLTAGPDDGSFVVTYRIQEARETFPSEESGTFSQIIDTSYAAPYNLRALDYWRSCHAVTSGAVLCDQVDEPGLTWDYAVHPDWRHTFRVYMRRAGETAPHLFYESFRGFTFSPQASEDCNTSVYYSVSAVVRTDAYTGEPVESPPSPELEIPSSCAELEITLLTLDIHDGVLDGEYAPLIGCFDDCDPNLEAYGWLGFNGHMLKWNNHEGCDSFPDYSCLAGPGFTSLAAGSHSWADMSLGNVRSWGTGRNVFRIPIEEGQSLSVVFDFWDHDPVSPDDLWCGWDLGRTSGIHARGSYFNLEPRSLREWLALDQDVTVVPAEHQNCTVTFHVRGIP